MLFRYKIKKSYTNLFGTDYICYNTKIQRYNTSNIIFKWETCEDTTLKSIVEILGTEYCFTEFDNALQEIYETISKYGSVDKMISEYIWKIIIRDMKREDMKNNLEKSIDDIVLRGNWKTIEFKENG